MFKNYTILKFNDLKNLIFLYFLFISTVFNTQNLSIDSLNNGVTKTITQFPTFSHSPVGIPMRLAGNFAELRKNHFHGGIDIKTNGQEGYNIYSVGDGYVSRINVKENGYGNALYIDHPNGYTSVYAHLKGFSSKIDEYIRKIQYQLKESNLEYYPEPGTLMVEGGEMVAISGNTGGSTAPHLHFEIRETLTEKPTNPMFFGFNVKDTSKPVIVNLYGLVIEGEVNGASRLTRIYAGKTYNAKGKISFGVKAYDMHDGESNKNGVFNIKMYVNDALFYEYQADQFSFDETRYIYSLTDYPAYAAYRSWIYKTYRDEGSILSMYENLHNEGVLHVEAGKKYTVRFEVADFAGNTNTQFVYINGQAYNALDDIPYNVPYNEEVIIEKDNIQVVFPSNTFPTNERIDLEVNGNHFTLGDSYTPVMKPFPVYIQLDQTMDEVSRNQYYLEAKSNKGRSETATYPLKWNGEKLEGNVRLLGDFYLKKDSNPPTIVSAHLKNGGSFSHNNTARFKVYDNETDIQRFDFYVDGNWTLGRYDKKYKSVYLDFKKEGIPIGTHQIKLVVTDVCSNTKEFSAKIRVY